MEILEINDEEGNVQQLRISDATAEEANNAACDWCEENNCLLQAVDVDANLFIFSVCSDDYDHDSASNSGKFSQA